MTVGLRRRRRVVQASSLPLVLLVALAIWIYTGTVPNVENTQSLTITDRHGEILYEPLASGGNRAQWLRPENLPPRVVEATLAAEDRRFYRHPGVDPIAIARAMFHNVRALHVVEGGSTITQQVAKLLLGSQKRTLAQKAREAAVALRLERRYSKREILALYLNLAPYGNRINGVARASRAYFGCAPAQLTAAQAAFLASLPQRPTAFNPLRNPKAARARQLAVLARMPLPREEFERARRERLQFAEKAQPVLAMHFVERVLAQHPRGALVRTSLDANLQRDVAGIIAAHREELLRHGAHSAAVAVLDNATGEWLAWEGSGDYFGEEFGGAIDGVITPRQPGSTLKPFTYALAFERGRSPATVLDDEPSHFATAEEGVVYTPRNYDGKYRGPLRVRAALAGSQNVPAVALLSQLGPESLLRLLRNSGFTGLDRTADYYGLGLTLGDAEVTLEQLVRSYATFARGGTSVVTKHRLLSPRTAFWITDILSDSDARAYAFGTGGSLDFPFPVAVKTGTSTAYRDNWTIGYTREVTVGVWVGNFDRKELRGSSGVTGAAPIFNGVMLAAMKRARGNLPLGDSTPIVAIPNDVESVEICTLSGLRPSPWCPATRHEWLPRGETPRFCASHQPPTTTTPATTPAPTPTQRTAALRIQNPPNGATYLIDPTLRKEFQTLRLRAVPANVIWHVDATRVAGNEWPLTPGTHVVTAVDGRGRRESVRITVR